MGLEDSENLEVNKPFKEGDVSDLTEKLELLEHKIQGLFVALDPDAGRLVEVQFTTLENQEQLTGHVEKWNSEGDLWVMVQKEPKKSEFKHYRLPSEHNISWRLINLNK